MRRIIGSLVVVVMMGTAVEVWAEKLKVFPLFTDHAILQQDTEAPVWGTAEAGVAVTVSFRGMKVTTTADKEGKWLARLRTPKAEAGQRGTELTITAGDQTIVLGDVLVGEVWLGSGQSNMETTLGWYPIGKVEGPKANYPDIRLYTGAGYGYWGDYSQFQWSRCTPEVAKATSATGYLFSKELYLARKVPVGFVVIACDGSSMADWLEADWLTTDPRTAKQYKWWFQYAYPNQVAKRQEQLAKWEKDVADAKASGRNAPPPRPFDGPAEWVGMYYRTHLQPAMPFAFRGVLWDQGEQGVGASVGPYDLVFEVMIEKWRKGFGQELPVVYCQMPKGGGWGPLARQVIERNGELGAAIPLANLPATVPGPGKVFEGFAKEEDPFSRMMALDKCWMAVTRDLCVAVHPPDKDHYAHRFFLTAMSQVYGEKVEWLGPMMKAAKREGGKVRVSFEHVGIGLAALGGKNLQGFVLTGNEKGLTKSVWAKGVIDGDTVVLTGEGLESVKLVSYAPGGRVMWANLFNKDGLPAYPMTVKVENE
jgi:sialate O-acetylesterase